MKQTLFPILLFILCSVNLTAQDAIVLDGKKIPKNELNPYTELGYKIDLTKSENKPSLKSPGIDKNKIISDQRVFASKGMKSFLQSSFIINPDSVDYLLPSSNLKFFDENGKIKWEKNLDGKTPRFCFLSPDGVNSILDITVWKSGEFGGSDNSLSIFDDNGNTIFEHPTPVKYQISNSRDIVCYHEDIDFTKNKEDENSFSCIDLKTGNQWKKTFVKEVRAQPITMNGDYIRAGTDSFYTIYNRNGNEIFTKCKSEFGGHIDALSNDGKYVLTFINDTIVSTFFYIYTVATMERTRTNYLDVGNAKYKIYNGGKFVNNSYYLIALTSIIAPYTAMIIFHNLKGEYIGHKVYYDIPCGFYYPSITLLEDGSFEVYMDGYYLENLTLPGVNTLQYLSKTTE